MTAAPTDVHNFTIDVESLADQCPSINLVNMVGTCNPNGQLSLLDIDVLDEDDLFDPYFDLSTTKEMIETAFLDRFGIQTVVVHEHNPVNGWPNVNVTGTPNALADFLGWYYGNDLVKTHVLPQLLRVAGEQA